jgi:DNA-binding CsgD family transcriptional regulator
MGMLLSEREFEILKLVEQGLSSEKIAKKLFLSINTVNSHRTKMLNKTGKKNISDLIYSYKDQGLM